MASNIKDLLYNAGGNLARPTFFRSEITLPSILSQRKSVQDYDILCKSVSMPEYTTKTNEITYKGATFILKARSSYSRIVSLSFLVDEKHDLVRDLIAWSKGIDNFSMDKNIDEKKIFDTMYIEGIDSILGEMKITALNWDEYDAAVYKFKNIFPTKVGPIEFNGEGKSSVIELPVEFAFLSFNKIEDFETIPDFTETVKKSITKGLNNLFEEQSNQIKLSIEEKSKALQDLLNNGRGLLSG